MERKLKLTLNLSHEEVVDHYIVGWVIEFVPDFDYFEFGLHIVPTIEQVHSSEDVDEATLAAHELGPDQVHDSEYYQVDILKTSPGQDLLTCLQ